MGQKQSKDELLYHQVEQGNIEGIKALYSNGAGIEWVDSDGKTSLTLACSRAELYTVAETLIEMGANVYAHNCTPHTGTPLHYAVKEDLENTVRLLLSHTAHALVLNDDAQTPLDVARMMGFVNIVRAIENHICFFSGWLRELKLYGLGWQYLEVFAPKVLPRFVWVVILPCGMVSRSTPILPQAFDLQLVIYSTSQCGKPCTVIRNMMRGWGCGPRRARGRESITL